MNKVFVTIWAFAFVLSSSVSAAGEDGALYGEPWEGKPLVIKTDGSLPLEGAAQGRSRMVAGSAPAQSSGYDRTTEGLALPQRGAEPRGSSALNGSQEPPTPQSVEDIAKQVIGVHANKALNERRRAEELERVKIEAEIAKTIKECKESGGCKGGEYSSYGANDFQSLFDSKDSATSSDSVPQSVEVEYAPLPKLVRVTGTEAMFETSIGKIRASAGSALPGGYTVKSVSLKGAVVEKADVSFKIALSWQPDSNGVENTSAFGAVSTPTSMPGF